MTNDDKRTDKGTDIKLTRRQMLAGSAALGISAIAGCSGSEDGEGEEYQEGGGEAEAAEGNNASESDGVEENEAEADAADEQSAEDVENRPEGEDVLEFGDLAINEHELVIDEGEYSDDITIEGIVENRGDEIVDYAEVGARVYDPDGHQLDRYYTNTQDLQAGGTWAFEILVLEDAEDVDSYDIGVKDTPF